MSGYLRQLRCITWDMLTAWRHLPQVASVLGAALRDLLDALWQLWLCLVALLLVLVLLPLGFWLSPVLAAWCEWKDRRHAARPLGPRH